MNDSHANLIFTFGKEHDFNSCDDDDDDDDDIDDDDDDDDDDVIKFESRQTDAR